MVVRARSAHGPVVLACSDYFRNDRKSNDLTRFFQSFVCGICFCFSLCSGSRAGICRERARSIPVFGSYSSASSRGVLSVRAFFRRVDASGVSRLVSDALAPCPADFTEAVSVVVRFAFRPLFRGLLPGFGVVAASGGD